MEIRINVYELLSEEFNSNLLETMGIDTDRDYDIYMNSTTNEILIRQE